MAKSNQDAAEALRKVNAYGNIRWHGETYRVPDRFAGKWLEVREAEVGGVFVRVPETGETAEAETIKPTDWNEFETYRTA